jgi:ATP-dependent 26S proteasome regulatory subunit
VLNSFLQFVEADDSDSLILAATNQVEVLDPALFRRLDDVIRYGLPTADAAEESIRNALNVFTTNGKDWTEVRRACDGLSYAEIARACTEAAKGAILTDRRDLSTHEIQAALGQRQAIRQQ